MEKNQFVDVCREILLLYDYKLLKNDFEESEKYDFFVEKDNEIIAVEVKYCRQSRPNRFYFEQAVIRTISNKPDDVDSVMIMISGFLDDLRNVYSDLPINIYDGKDIICRSKKDSILYEKVMQLLPQRIESSEDKLDSLDEKMDGKKLYVELQNIEKDRKKYSEELIRELKSISPGKKQTEEYMLHLRNILEYMLGYDLIGWWDQMSSEDGSKRCDTICRLRSNHEFWQMIKEDFNSRYITFVYKNYQDPITPHEIFTTERYLYNTAKRSFSIIISRKGLDKKAQLATFSALRVYGKCIIGLSDNDIIKMIRMLNNGDDPHNLLFDKYDELMTRM